MMTKQKR